MADEAPAPEVPAAAELAPAPEATAAEAEAGGVKRPLEDGAGEAGDAKRQASGPDLVYRILCHKGRVGSVIGKGGATIKGIRESTGARIKIEDEVHGCDERVVYVSSSDASEESTKAESAMMQLFEIICTPAEPAASEGAEAPEPPTSFKLLVPSVQVGCLIGKQGSIVKDMRDRTGTDIKVQQHSQLPSVALESDELVLVQGPLGACRTALPEIMTRLKANPPQDKPGQPRAYSGKTVGEAQAAAAAGAAAAAAAYQFTGAPPPVASFAGGATGVVTFRYLCPASRLPALVGTTGEVLRRIIDETGAQVTIADEVPGVTERVIIISGEDSSAPSTPAEEALLRAHACATEGDVDERGQARCRMLIPSGQVGAILGPKGSIITALREETGALIRILPQAERPACALDSDDLLQIIGQPANATNAVRTIAARLRANPPSERAPGPRAQPAWTPPAPAPYAQPPPAYGQPPPAYGGYYGQPPPAYGGYYGQPPPAYGQPPPAYGAPPPAYGAPPPAYGGAPPPYGSPPPYGGPPGGGNVLTMGVPHMQVGSVLGKGGANIQHVRQVSGARLKLHPAIEGTPERQLDITGTPEQCASAQALVQQYIANSTAPRL